MGRYLCLVLLILAGGPAASQSLLGNAKAKHTLTERPLSRVPSVAGTNIVVSPDNKQVAFKVLRGGKYSVWVNGREGESYKRIGEELVFSPNSKRFAYAAQKALDHNVVVLDGKESRDYEYLPSDLTFSPGSKKFAFDTADSNSFFVVLEGQPHGNFESICRGGPSVRALFFSPDESRLAYSAKMKNPDGQIASMIVVEGDRQIVYRAEKNAVVHQFSPGSESLAYSLQGRGKWRIGINEKLDPEFDDIASNSSRFSPDGKQLVYFARRDAKWVWVLNGKEGPVFDTFGDVAPVWSADSRNWACVAVRGETRVVLINGTEAAVYEGVVPTSLAFSPDSLHHAYVAVSGYKYILVRDGTRSAPSDDVALLPFFSPDSHHLCHAILLNGKVRVYLDGKPGKEYDGVVPTWACFSPDSQHLAYGALRDGKLVLVVDGEEIATYEKPFGKLLFQDAQHLSGVVLRFSNSEFAEEIVRIEVDLAID